MTDLTALVPVQVPFHGDVLEAVKDDGKVWVSLRRCCENLGVSVQGQLTKLRGKPWAVVKEKLMTAPDGKQYATTVIDLETLPGWLFDIDPRKVKEHVREKLARYQREAARVLADHFYGRTTPAPVIDPAVLLETVRLLIREELKNGTQTVVPLAPTVPQFTVLERCRWQGWTTTGSNQRQAVRKLANWLLKLRHGESPDTTGMGGPLLYHGHQLACLDDAIDRTRDEYAKKERDLLFAAAKG